MRAYATEDGAKRAKNGCWSTAFRRRNIAVKINNKPAGSLEDGDKPSETEKLSRKDLVGEVGSIVSLTKQQIAVYKNEKADTASGVLENVRLEVVRQEKDIHKATLIATDGYKLIRREVNAEPGAKTCSMNIPQSVLVAADKVMKTDFDRAYVHDGKIIVHTNPLRRNDTIR